MAPTYSRGNCTDDVAAKEGVTFSLGTSSVLNKNGSNAPATESANVIMMDITTQQKANKATTAPTVEFPELLEKAHSYKMSSRKVFLLSRVSFYKIQCNISHTII